MNLTFKFPPAEIERSYIALKHRMRGNDDVIFLAMQKVSTGALRPPFELPSDPTKIEEKHKEVISILRSRKMPDGLGLAIGLMEEVVQNVKANGGLPGLREEDLLNDIVLKPEMSGVVLRLNSDVRWQIELEVIDPSSRGNTKVPLTVHSKMFGEIVPDYIVQYTSAAIQAYNAHLNAAAVALITIVVEATLRDLLSVNGFPYDPFAATADVYEFTHAELSTNGMEYIVRILDHTPAAPTDFVISNGGNTTSPIELKRTYNTRKKRWEILLKIDNDTLLDHLTSNTIIKPAGHRIGGLGEALELARNKDLVKLSVLPAYLDEVLKVVRNNLIHLSEAALNTPIDGYTAQGITTLEDFINDPLIVLDLVERGVNFANSTYVELREAGHLAT